MTICARQGGCTQSRRVGWFWYGIDMVSGGSTRRKECARQRASASYPRAIVPLERIMPMVKAWAKKSQMWARATRGDNEISEY